MEDVAGKAALEELTRSEWWERVRALRAKLASVPLLAFSVEEHEAVMRVRGVLCTKAGTFTTMEEPTYTDVLMLEAKLKSLGR